MAAFGYQLYHAISKHVRLICVILLTFLGLLFIRFLVINSEPPSGYLQNESNVISITARRTNLYIVRQGSRIQFDSYGPDVDLRVIVIAYDRAQSLQRCLNALNAAYYGNSTVSIHVWIDRDKDTEKYPQDTYEVANSFEFNHYKGAYRVHVQDSHVGIQGQWINTWRPHKSTKEVAIILEDDMDVSPYFWRWLKGPSTSYSGRNDVSGYGLHGPGNNHIDNAPLRIPNSDSVYMYPIICTWGFAPHPRSWREFQTWFFTVRDSPTVDLAVPGILPWEWYKAEEVNGRAETVWEMWHISFTYKATPQQYNIQPNTGEGYMFAVNRQEKGLHFPDALGPSGVLVGDWKEKYAVFPESPTMYDAGGIQLPGQSSPTPDA